MQNQISFRLLAFFLDSWKDHWANFHHKREQLNKEVSEPLKLRDSSYTPLVYTREARNTY